MIAGGIKRGDKRAGLEARIANSESAICVYRARTPDGIGLAYSQKRDWRRRRGKRPPPGAPGGIFLSKSDN